MIALGVVLGDELPVRADLVADLLGRAEGPEVEPVPVGHEIGQVVGQLGSVGIERDEHEALPDGEADRAQAERVEAELVEVLGVLGPDELAVEVVDPGVVGALEADGLAAGLFDDGRAPVLADVVEGPQDAIPGAHDHERLAVLLGQEILARPAGIRLAPDDRPVPVEPLAPFELVDLGVVVGPPGQERGGPVRTADRGELLRGQDRHRWSPASRPSRPDRMKVVRLLRSTARLRPWPGWPPGPSAGRHRRPRSGCPGPSGSRRRRIDRRPSGRRPGRWPPGSSSGRPSSCPSGCPAAGARPRGSPAGWSGPRSRRAPEMSRSDRPTESRSTYRSQLTIVRSGPSGQAWWTRT